MSLAAALGLDPVTRPVVLNGDDLGMCRAQNDATFEGLLSGHLSSATLMVPCPWAYDAARRAAAERLPVGVHLALTAEWDTYRWGPVTADVSLRDDEGFLPRSVPEVYARADLAAVRRECFAQVETAMQWGVDVSHVDSHMGTNQLQEDYFDVYLDVAEHFDLPLRMGPIALEEPAGFPQRRAAEARGLLFCDDLVLGNGDAAGWEAMLAGLRPGVSECFLHTALDTPELRAIAGDADRRVTDHWLATAPGSPFADRHLVTYTDIRARQRSRRPSGP